MVHEVRQTLEETAQLLTFDSYMQSKIVWDPIQAMDMAEADGMFWSLSPELKIPALDGL